MSSSSWAERVRQTLEVIQQNYNNEEIDKNAQFYHENIRVFPPGGPDEKGKQAMLGALKKAFQRGGRTANIELVEVLQDLGNVAVCKHDFKVFKEEGSVLFSARQLHIWELVNGKPQISTCMWNLNKESEKKDA